MWFGFNGGWVGCCRCVIVDVYYGICFGGLVIIRGWVVLIVALLWFRCLRWCVGISFLVVFMLLLMLLMFGVFVVGFCLGWGGWVGVCGFVCGFDALLYFVDLFVLCFGGGFVCCVCFDGFVVVLMYIYVSIDGWVIAWCWGLI